MNAKYAFLIGMIGLVWAPSSALRADSATVPTPKPDATTSATY